MRREVSISMSKLFSLKLELFFEGCLFNLNHSLGKFSRQPIGDIFPRKDFHRTTCMKCQVLFFWGNNKKNTSI